VARKNGRFIEISGEHYLSTIPLAELIACLDPPPPDDVLRAAKSLFYRDLILIGLIVDHPNLFPDQWIYIHSPQVKVSRIQNFKNWSIRMVPDPMKTSLGMEYFCTEGDGLWMRSDSELIELATRELIHLGLTKAGEVKEGVVIRQSKAYPVYDDGYRKHLERIQQFLVGIENLQSIGRNGMHRYNNQDHSMLTAMFAVKNLLGEPHDLWGVNLEQSYYENL
jgi:protoporphyrinogen oxidase